MIYFVYFQWRQYDAWRRDARFRSFAAAVDYAQSTSSMAGHYGWRIEVAK